jgi:hypothetical protein
MKFVRISIALRIALLWLLEHLKPSEQPSEQELIEYSKELAQRRIPRLLPETSRPGTYEPPEKTTNPAMQVHHLAETGRIASMIRTKKLPTVKGLHKAHFYRMPSTEEVQADKFLLDVEPPAPEPDSALYQLSQLAVTDVKLEAVRARHQKHEGRDKAS